MRETLDRSGWPRLGEYGGERAHSTWLAVFEKVGHAFAEILTG
ncbi:MAG: hypothetical protein ACR2N0_02435 [Rubrobacteraceae bacterium]